jgi:hypothetical protein
VGREAGLRAARGQSRPLTRNWPAVIEEHEEDKARVDKAGVMWRGLMGTDGTFDAVFVDRATGQEVRRLPQRAGIAWVAELPAPECDAAQGPTTQARMTPNSVTAHVAQPSRVPTAVNHSIAGAWY